MNQLQPKQVQSDIVEVNAILTELYSAINNIISNLGSPTPTTGGTAEGQLVNLAYGQFWKTFKTTDFGKTFLDGTRMGSIGLMGIKSNPVDGTDRSDPVLILMSYNVPLPNGSREFPTEAGFELVFELAYPNPYGATLKIPDFELYLRIYTVDGKEMRHGIYANKSTGNARKDTQVYMEQWMLANGFVYANLADASMNLSASQVGRVAGFTATQHKDLGGQKLGFWNTGGTSYLQIPDVIEAYGNPAIGASHIKLKLPSYADDIAAKADGLKVGESYWIKVNGKSQITKVEG